MAKENKMHPSHKAQLDRLRRIEGQVRGLQNMIQGGQYCINILSQFKAVHAALKKVEIEILEKHIESCVVKATKSGKQRDITAKVNEIVEVVSSIGK